MSVLYIELMKVNSESFDEEETVFHLCVTYNRLNLLIRLLKLNDYDLSNIKDGNDDTVLHTAAALKRVQMIKYLVKSRNKVDVNAVNKKGLTALDIVEQMPKDLKMMEIKELLISSANPSMVIEDVVPTTKATTAADDNGGGGGGADDDSIINVMKGWWNKMKKYTILQEKAAQRDEYVLLAATVIASIAYQAAISPPGGVSSGEAPDSSNQYPELYPGDSFLAYFNTSLSNVFWTANTISYMAALSVIFLYVSGATLKQKLFIWLIRAAMWITLTANTLAYACAVAATHLNYNADDYTVNGVLVGLIVWLGLIFLSLLAVIFRAIRYMVRKIIKKNDAWKKRYTSRHPASITPQNIHVVSFNSPA
ncbi:uncharacterized protein LOC108212932 [Daucus carota subsp. sativus]|uniref:uncharacterized protein LOC108212932 n=1 Tax=Daucus carota subsp. sativus TaxID=79200 RepID=UPI003083EA53